MPGDTILVLTPQRTLAEPYQRFLRSPDAPGGSAVTLATVGGLARRTIDLLWPLIAEQAGFRQQERPIFLTLETAQFYMDRALAPFLEKRYFRRRHHPPKPAGQPDHRQPQQGRGGRLPARRDRRAAGAGLGGGEPAQLRTYEQVQECASAFRAYCLANNLLDFSLQFETFLHHLLTRAEGQAYLFDRYRHLIADNLEEDVPVAHDLVSQWLAAPSRRRWYTTGMPAIALSSARIRTRRTSCASSVPRGPVGALLGCLRGVAGSGRPL